MTEWFDLSPYWQRAREIAEARTGVHRQSQHYSRNRVDVDFLGVLGEWVWFLSNGSTEEPSADLPPWEWNRPVRVRVRTTDSLSSGIHLLVAPGRAGLTASYYVLAQVDREHRRGRLVGWATKEEVAAVPLSRPFRTECHAIPAHQLHQNWSPS